MQTSHRKVSQDVCFTCSRKLVLDEAQDLRGDTPRYCSGTIFCFSTVEKSSLSPGMYQTLTCIRYYQNCRRDGRSATCGIGTNSNGKEIINLHYPDVWTRRSENLITPLPTYNNNKHFGERIRILPLPPTFDSSDALFGPFQDGWHVLSDSVRYDTSRNTK